MSKNSVALNFPFLIYAISGFIASLIILKYQIPYPCKGSDVNLKSLGLVPLRYAAFFALFLLGFGTGCDNARQFAGAFAYNFPDGVFELQNATLANQLVALHNLKGGGSLQALTWFSFFSHEVLGGSFALTGFYFWAVSASLPPKRSCSKKCASDCMLTYGFSGVGFIVAMIAMTIGLVGFITKTSHGLELRYNSGLGQWDYGPIDHSPVGLVGVFASSFVFIAVGIALLYGQKNFVFLLVQFLMVVGQGASISLGDYVGYLSNFLEQVLTYSLIFLGWWLSKEQRNSINADEQQIVAKSSD